MPIALKRRPRKMKATRKAGMPRLQKEEHPAGLWVDSATLARINGRLTRAPLRKEKSEVYSRYLELADLVLRPREREGPAPQEWKITKAG